MMDTNGGIYIDHSAKRQSLVVSSMRSLAIDAADTTDDDNFASILESRVSVSISSVKSNTDAIKTRPVPTIDHAILPKCWSITPERTKATVQKTTQQGVQVCLHLSGQAISNK